MKGIDLEEMVTINNISTYRRGDRAIFSATASRSADIRAMPIGRRTILLSAKIAPLMAAMCLLVVTSGLPSYAGEGELVLLRQVPPRVAYVKAAPGPAVIADTSPEFAVSAALSIRASGPDELANAFPGRELTEVEVASIRVQKPVITATGSTPLQATIFSRALPGHHYVTAAGTLVAPLRTSVAGAAANPVEHVPDNVGVLIQHQIINAMTPLNRPQF